MSKCAIFMNSGNEKQKNNVEIGSTRDDHSHDDFGETQIQIMTNENPINEESPKDPIIDESPASRSRSPDRKVAKNVKRKASIEAHSSIGERMAKSLDEMQAASSVGWQKTIELKEDDQKLTIQYKKLQMIIGRMKFEKELIIAERNLCELEPTVFGSPSEKAELIAVRKRRLADLQAQADAFTEDVISLAPSTSQEITRNLNSSFAEEASE